MRSLLFCCLSLISSTLLAQSEKGTLEDLDVPALDLTEVLEESSPLIITGKASLGIDVLSSDDIDIERYSADFEISLGDTTIGVGYQRTDFEVGFAGPRFDDTTLNESTDSYSLSLAQKWNETYSSSLSLSGYDGFTNFRSIWFPEFFSQEAAFFPGFRDLGDPFGYSIGLTNTYTFDNTLDSIDLSLSYSRDRIVPAQQIAFDPFTGPFIDIGDNTIETFVVGLTGNFYLTNKITSQWSARASFISDRDVRTQYRVRTAWNPFHELTIRTDLGATIEKPDFEGFFAGVTVDYQILDSLTASIGYRFYTDTGDITAANSDRAAPEFDSREISASLL